MGEKHHGLAQTAVITLDVTIRGWSGTTTLIIYLSGPVLSPIIVKWIIITTPNNMAVAYDVRGIV